MWGDSMMYWGARFSNPGSRGLVLCRAGGVPPGRWSDYGGSPLRGAAGRWSGACRAGACTLFLTRRLSRCNGGASLVIQVDNRLGTLSLLLGNLRLGRLLRRGGWVGCPCLRRCVPRCPSGCVSCACPLVVAAACRSVARCLFVTIVLRGVLGA